MEWTNEKTFELIELYRSHACLWDPKSKFYKLLNKKSEAWNAIASELNSDVMEVKKKMNSLLSSFRRERQKEGTAKKSGSGADEVYHSTWFAFKSLGFLMDKFQPRDTQNTDENDMAGTEDNSENLEEEPQDTSGQQELLSPRAPSSSVCRNQRKRPVRETRVDEAYDIMKETVAKKASKSSEAAFGQYIASKLEKYPVRCRNIVQHLINNIIFEVDMGKYDECPPYISQTPTHGSHPVNCLPSASRQPVHFDYSSTNTTGIPLPSPASQQSSFSSRSRSPEASLSTLNNELPSYAPRQP